MARSKARRVGVGQGSPDDALTLAHLPLGVLVTVLISTLFAFAFDLGLAPPLISLAILAALIAGVGVATGQLRLSAAAGTRLTLAHLALASLLGGVAAAPPAAFTPLLLWSLTALAAAATGIVAVEAWLSEKIGAAGPFSRRIGRETLALVVLALAVLLWRSGAVGGWIVAAGLLHYARLAASLVLPSLRGDSPAAWRHYIGPATVALLIAALAPLVPPVMATVLAAASLTLAIVAAATDLTAPRS